MIRGPNWLPNEAIRKSLQRDVPRYNWTRTCIIGHLTTIAKSVHNVPVHECPKSLKRGDEFDSILLPFNPPRNESSTSHVSLDVWTLRLAGLPIQKETLRFLTGGHSDQTFPHSTPYIPVTFPRTYIVPSLFPLIEVYLDRVLSIASSHTFHRTSDQLSTNVQGTQWKPLQKTMPPWHITLHRL